MYITKIHIDKFGSLHDREVVLTRGLNIIEGANESGKSTLSRFIKYIFYGFSDKGERERSIGFSDDSVGGYIELTAADGKSYRVYRATTAGGRDKYSISDAETGAETESSQPWEIFLGVDGSVFEHTAFVGQAGGGRVNGAEVGEAIENILFSADEGVNTKRALKKLEESRVLLRHKKGRGGRIPELEDKGEELRAALDEAQNAAGGIISREGSLRDNRDEYEKNENSLKELYKIREYHETGELEKRRRKIRELLKKAAELEEERNRITAEASNGGFLPDGEYLSSLKTASSALIGAERDRTEAEIALNTARAEKPDSAEALRRAAIAEQHGGRDSVIEKIRLLRKKQKSSFLSAVLLFALAAISAGAGAVLSPQTALLAGFMILALILAASGVLLLISRSKSKKSADSLIFELGIGDESNLENEIDLAISEKAAAAEHENRLRSLEGALKVRSGDLDRAVKESERLLALWGKSSLAGAIDEVGALLSRLEKNRTDTEQYKAAARAAAEQMTVSGDELDRRIQALGVTDEGMAAIDIEAVNLKIKFNEGKRESLDERYNILERELAVLRATVRDPMAIASTLAATEKEKAVLSEKYDALVLARDMLTEAGDGLRDSISPRLSREAGKYLADMTGGKYDSLGIGQGLEMSFTPEGGGARGSEYMSAGTADLAYLALRLSLTGLLFRIELPPLVFDESFARIDDERLSKILACLSGFSDDGVQSIVLTSGSREGRISGQPVLRL